MMAKNLIPESALKKHIAILGMNGSGKTSVAKSQIIEPALAAGERVCNIDPTGVGWGLRLNASGKSKGYPMAPKMRHCFYCGEEAAMPTAAQIARFLECFETLSRYEAQHQVIRGYGAFDPVLWPDKPDPAVVEVLAWLKSHAHT
jgi:hypothetical protein